MINSLKILHINIQSIDSESKTIQLTHMANIYKIDIISLNETFLKPNKQFNIPGYHTFRSDRIGRRGGGAAICIKSNIFATEIPLNNQLLSENAVGIEIPVCQNDKISIFSIYSSPSTKLNESLLEHITSNYKNYIIIGDLNCKNKIWHCKDDNANGLSLENFLSKSNSHILNCPKPTYLRGKSVIDLSITSSSMMNNFQYHKVLNHTISDHQPTITVFKNLQITKRSFTIKRVNWDIFRNEVSKKLPANNLNTIDEIENEATALINDLRSSLEYATKTKTFATKATNPVEIPKALVDLIKLKRKLKRSLNKNSTEYGKKMFNFVCRKVKNGTKSFNESKIRFEFKQLENFKQSDSKHWNLLKKLNESESLSQKDTNLKLLKSNNNVTNDEDEIVSIFGDHLVDIFTPDHGLMDFTSTNLAQIECPLNDKISKDEFLNALKSINIKSAPGIDNINNKVFKNSPKSVLIRLFRLFNASLKIGYLPKEWKKSKIIMIHKKGKPPDKASSYRPISLIPCIAKLMEKIINNKLLTWLEKNKLLPPCQSGFRKSMSTHDHFLRL